MAHAERSLQMRLGSRSRVAASRRRYREVQRHGAYRAESSPTPGWGIPVGISRLALGMAGFS